MNIKNFVIDVDGVLSTGQFFYTSEGKVMKVFGPHDADGIKLIKNIVQIRFITADWRGFDITKKRIDDMNCPLELVSEEQRFGYIEDIGFEHTAFMGDGYFDAKIMPHVAWAFAPKNARKECLDAADYVTPSRAGEGAVMDACLFLKKVLENESEN